MTTGGYPRPNGLFLPWRPKFYLRTKSPNQASKSSNSFDGSLPEDHSPTVTEDAAASGLASSSVSTAAGAKEPTSSTPSSFSVFRPSRLQTSSRSSSGIGSGWSAFEGGLTSTSSLSITRKENRAGLSSSSNKTQDVLPVPIEQRQYRTETSESHQIRFDPDLPTLQELSPPPEALLIRTVDRPASAPPRPESYRSCKDEPHHKLQKRRRSLDGLGPERKPQRHWNGKTFIPDADDGANHAEHEREPTTAVVASQHQPELEDVAAAQASSNGRSSEPTVHDGNQETNKTITFNTTQLPLRTRLTDSDGSLRKRGRRKVLLHKYIMQVAVLGINGFLIFGTWHWLRYYYVFLPLICAPVVLNVVMVFSIIVYNITRPLRTDRSITPAQPESLVLLVPCYNETREEVTRSLDSLAGQQDIDAHPQALLIICDGKVRGPGMAKTTADALLQDILTHRTARAYLRAAYTAWDQQPMDVVIQTGRYRGRLPYCCIVKQQNRGKRDGLILARSFLYHFNRRAAAPATIFAAPLFDRLAAFLLADAAIAHVDHLVGLDADTVFDAHCVAALLAQSRDPRTVGVCGYVAVDWQDGRWNPWRLYQSAEYTIAQGLRRLHQSVVTHKVSCLPGCCQLLRVCEATCGDAVLIDRFGACPDATDGLLRHIRATASEDRNHVCTVLSARPAAQTRQALRARAATDVPRSWAVFLSQRRRWTLGATANDLLLVGAPGVQWFERLLALTNVATWFLTPFVFAALASFLYAITVVPAWIVLCFVSVMLVPVAYALAIPLWLGRTWPERVQFWAGCGCYLVGGPVVNLAVLLYACVYLDAFGWGKTRQVVAAADAADGACTQTELERLAAGEPAAEQTRPQQRQENTGRQDIDAAWSGEERCLDAEERRIGDS